METSARLSELLQHLQRVISLNFPTAVWLEVEVAQCQVNRGHTYLQLVEKDQNTDKVIAQSNAVLWANRRAALESKAATPLDAALQEGHALRLCVKPEHHPIYGFKLLIEDIDLAFSLGQLALRRRQIIEALQRERLLDKNRQTPLSPVIQRIAVVSSPQAAGWQDFEQHLLANPMGYRFQWRLFPASMQGQAVEAEVDGALARIQQQAAHFDAVVILRGGGSKMDLAWFDNERLGRRIATMPIPVFTGIGHDIDETICDLVAWQAFKTPTAVANWIIDHNYQFENSLMERASLMATLVRRQCMAEAARLTQVSHAIRNVSLRALDQADFRLKQSQQKLTQTLRQQVKDAHRHLEKLEALQRHLNPTETLKRGYSITLFNGKPLLRAAEAPPGSELRTVLHEGEITSTSQ